MRFIFQLLIGMILFNAMLIMFSPYFSTQREGSTYNPVNISDTSPGTVGEKLGGYQNLNILDLLSGFFATFVTSFFIFTFIGFISGGSLPLAQLLGISLVVSVFTSLWGTLSNPLVSIADEFPAVAPFYTIFTIVLGVVVMISVIEILTGKGDETA
jgi:hypothetical protein